MEFKKIIKIAHINGDHYIPIKSSMKMYDMLLLKIKHYFKVNENLIEDENLDSLRNCRGCKQCFKKGKCIYDTIDDILQIKEQLFMSDLIIVSSPVFIDSISGNIKTLLDRLSYWFHTMPLMGKKCIIIISTYRTGKDEVSNYLYKVCSYLGLEVVGILTSDYRTSYDELEGAIDICIDNLINMLLKNKSSSSFRDIIFKVYDESYLKMNKEGEETFESTYWCELHH